MSQSRIVKVRHRLIDLHKAIIEVERIALERVEGRLTGNQMLQRLVTDERFNWLRALTEMIVQLDELLEADTVENVEACFALIADLLKPEGAANPFRTEYARLLLESPEVTVAHAAAAKTLAISAAGKVRGSGG